MKEIATALIKAQQEIGKAHTDKTNPHFRSKYASLEAVMDAVLPALHKHGLCVIQAPKVHTRLKGGLPNGEEFQTLETMLIHESGQEIVGTYLLKPVKEDPQGYGSALTYARRYSLASMLGVVQEDDDGHAASKPTPSAMDKLEAELKEAETTDQVKAITKRWEEATSNNKIAQQRGLEKIEARWAELKAPE